MYFTKKQAHKSGLTFVEVIIVTALSTAIFGALLFSFKYTLELINVSRAKLSALSVANDRMEFFRSLPYADVGTVAGFPSGVIPQTSTTSLNNIEFDERVIVTFVDDPGDDTGVGGTDRNLITTDYKVIKVEYTWEINGNTDTISLISNIVPPGQETNEGGGTARFNVYDHDINPLPNASVRIFTASTSGIDITRLTDSNGVADIAVPADSGYEVQVTANLFGQQYSTEETYVPDATVFTPTNSPFTVVEAGITTQTFFIGPLSDFLVTTYGAFTDNEYEEFFSDFDDAVASTSAAIDGGALVLAETAGVYDATGSVTLGPITPSPLLAWEGIRLDGDIPAGTSYTAQLYSGVAPGPYTLIPEADLPGNTTGFSADTIDISALDPAAYPTIFVQLTLTTTDTNVTPEINHLSVFSQATRTAEPSVSFSIRGNKLLGTTDVGGSIYKFNTTTNTDAAGEERLVDLEYDTYTLDFTGYDIATACPGHATVHHAGVDTDAQYWLQPNAADTLRVVVEDAAGAPLPGIDVTLRRAGFNQSLVTNTCGQVFFNSGVGAHNDYEITVAGQGFDTETVVDFTIDGDVIERISLTKS